MNQLKTIQFSTGWLRILLAVLLVPFAGACGQKNNVATHIDGEWYRRNLEEAHLTHWLRALPTASDFFNIAVSRNWQALENQPGDLVGQTRAIYVIAIGHELTGNPEYLNQVKLGSDFLLKNFHDPLYGGRYVAVYPDGTMKIGNKRLYGHAFVILALTHAYRATKDQRYLDAALQTWQEIQFRFTDGKINRNNGYWQQAEALRAFMHHATIRGRSDLWARVTQMTELIQTELLDPENGGWFSAAAAGCCRGLCADLQPDGYHMTALHYEAIRLAKTVP